MPPRPAVRQLRPPVTSPSVAFLMNIAARKVSVNWDSLLKCNLGGKAAGPDLEGRCVPTKGVIARGVFLVRGNRFDDRAEGDQLTDRRFGF